MSKRRWGVVVNYIFLLLILILSMEGYLFGWSIVTKIGFWLSIIIVIATFFPVHVQTGLWRLAHARADVLDEREIQQNLGSLRHAYVAFSIICLLIFLALVFFQPGQIQSLVIFWVLLYLAHTLPSSILAWTATRVAIPDEQGSLP